MTFSDAQLQDWLQAAFWPFVRIGGVMMTAPVIGERFAPARVRLIVALVLLMAILPVLPARPAIPVFSSAWWMAGVEELGLGVLIGFLLRLVFEAMMLAGEVIGYGMGLGFARLADPVHGTDAPVLGSLLRLLAMLVFLTLGGHLQLIQMLAGSFRVAPAGAAVLHPQMFESTAELGKILFSGALAVALPIAAAMLVVNIAFGVMNRSAPTLNAVSVGFPISLLAGMVLLGVDLRPMLGHFRSLLDTGWSALGALIDAAH